MALQRLFGVRINRDCRFVKADEWASLSHNAVQYLLAHEKAILKKYRFTFCCDEYVLATELTVGGLPVADDPNLLYVDFEHDHPRLLGQSDFENLKHSDYLFARKFDDNFQVQ